MNVLNQPLVPSAADALLAKAAAVAFLNKATAKVHVRLGLRSLARRASASPSPKLACRIWGAHRLLCDDTLERDGLHGGLLLRGGSGGHFGSWGGEGCDGYPVCCCVVGIGRGGYRLQACQRVRKECWREKGDGLPFTGKQWAIYSPSDPPSPLPPSPSSRPTFPLEEWSNEGANAGTERRRGSSAKLLDWTSGRSYPTQPAFSGRSGTSWLFSHVRRDKVPAFPTGRERGERIGQAASAYHLGAWRASTHSSNVDASSV